jgi:hypothetical protein
VGTPNVVEADVFPPSRSQAPDPSIFLPYIPEDIAFEEEYEEFLSDLGQQDQESGDQPLFENAWQRLPQYASEIADGISDSESVVSIGELGDEAHLSIGREEEIINENLNNWEVGLFQYSSMLSFLIIVFQHMSPKTMAALPKSPAGRRSSSGGGLRPVAPFGLDDSAVVDEDEEDLVPVPRDQPGPFAEGAGVDEVEYAYG